MNQDVFIQSVNEFILLAKAQGNVVSREQVEEQFTHMELNEEQMGFVYEYLHSNKIGVEEQVCLDDYLTDDEKNYLEIYLEELEALPNVTEEERLIATKAVMDGKEGVKEQLIQMYLPEVVSIAKLYTGQGVLLEDLIGEGNIGLTLGIEMIVCCETQEEAEGMIGKAIMDAMEGFIAEDTIQRDTVNTILERENNKLSKGNEV